MWEFCDKISALLTVSQCAKQVCNCDCIPVEPLLAPTCCKPQPQTVQEPQQKPVLDTCQMQQHAQSPLRGCGSMDLTSMHFPTAS